MDLNQVTLPSSDLHRSIPFYSGLGLQLIVRALPHYARFECPQGNSTFSLHLSENLPEKASGVMVYFETETLDEKVAELRTRGYQFDLLPTDQSWRWREARIKDPDGNIIVLFWAGEDRKNPPWRLPSGPQD
jgi:catechol 2,3-dioxygenase-like lactoylglutathione lyase family enzyme